MKLTFFSSKFHAMFLFWFGFYLDLISSRFFFFDFFFRYFLHSCHQRGNWWKRARYRIEHSTLLFERLPVGFCRGSSRLVGLELSQPTDRQGGGKRSPWTTFCHIHMIPVAFQFGSELESGKTESSYCMQVNNGSLPIEGDMCSKYHFDKEMMTQVPSGTTRFRQPKHGARNAGPLERQWECYVICADVG